MNAGPATPRVVAGDNPRIKRVRKLARSRRERVDSGAFVIEGPALVADAAVAGLALEYVVVPEGAAPPAEAGMAAVPVYAVPERVFGAITTTATPQPALAVAAVPSLPVVVGSGLVLCLAGVGDPGNVGTLIRAAEAAGAVGVLLMGDGADPYGPKPVRASAGSIFRIPVETIDAGELTIRANRAGVAVLGAVVTGGVAHDRADLSGPSIVVVGNETHGIDEAIAIDERISIEMAGGPESLNAAMAGTVLLFEARRQRRAQA